MLEKLIIENYALIERVEVDFGGGLSIISGETGAGKSILLGALNLLGGARVDSRNSGKREQKTVVEAIFGNIDEFTTHWLEESDELYESADDGKVILRREISPSGRTRAFVNDSPVTLARLQDVASHLIDIHSQNSNQGLAQNAEQLQLLDIYGATTPVLEHYRGLLKEYIKLRNKIKAIRRNAEKGKEARSHILFQLEQLEKIAPKKGELAAIEREFDVLSDAENIGSRLGTAISLLRESDQSAFQSIEESIRELDSLDISLLPALKRDNVRERLSQLRIEVKDIAETLSSELEDVQSNPARLAAVEKRMNELYDAKRHFKVADDDGLVNLLTELRTELHAIDGGGVETDELERRAKSIAAELRKKATELTELRAQAAKDLERKILAGAKPLGLENLKFEISLRPCKLNIDGGDAIEFMCTFNKQRDMQPLSKVASGGEMSRMMLAIKDAMAEKMQLPTVIFDEVDTGVSGEIAYKMGNMLGDMSKKMQVVSITHLPQVAAKGDTHYLVYKEDNLGVTHTHVKKLTAKERELEVARMLSGEVIDNAAIANARSLLRSN